jgi:hypothetical protein
MESVTIVEAKERHEADLLGLPNVAGVGIGESDGVPVIKVFVTEKVPESMLSPEERVPTRLEGYDVDVEAIGSVQSQMETKEEH